MDQHIAPVMWPFILALAAMVLFLLDWCVQGFVRLRRIQRIGSAALGSDSARRGLVLLRDWLSPAQLRAFDQHDYFDVIGSDSGTVFRIHHGTEANVEQLDIAGQPVCAWCFLPEGDLVAGDVMLAQKIALETDESHALSVAIKYAALRYRPAAWALTWNRVAH